MKEKMILVVGATGQQGGAVARQLLADGWKVRAFTRDSTGEKARLLEELGAELVNGDMDDRDSLDAAMKGVYGVFSVQPPSWNPTLESNKDEKRMGKAVVDAAQRAGVQHFVYTSVSGAEAQSKFRDMPKWEIEQYISSRGIPATILRPVGFMENFADPISGLQQGTLAQAGKPDGVIQLIAVDDIGAFALLAFKHPDDYLGKTIEIAGDGLTPPQIAAAISRATHRSIPYVQIPLETIRQHNEIVARLYQWLNDEGYEVDIAAARKLLPELMDFDTWLEKRGKAKFEALFRTQHT
ncbi:NmrA/HSCARG family protein [Paenibacillus sp. FSL H8-0034]|uniref:NmrA/HSCARG family protein n=1 Tax=Paenibacillus sp. FSL H8-0034 TaxID=2954671 RepID=UPI0030F7391E